LKKELRRRINQLPKEMRKILEDDMETALENRLKVLEKC